MGRNDPSLSAPSPRARSASRVKGAAAAAAATAPPAADHARLLEATAALKEARPGAMDAAPPPKGWGALRGPGAP